MTALSFALLHGGNWLGWHYLVSATASWIIPLCVGFVLNGRFTFAVESTLDGPLFGRYVGCAVAQWLVVCLGYFVTIGVFGLGLTASFVINAVVAALVSFTLMSVIVYGRPASALLKADARFTAKSQP